MRQKLPLVLASQSPRRRELLLGGGYEFEVSLPDETAECGLCSGESPAELVARLAWQKAANVAPRFERALVIGCDTVVECHGWILGKPEDRDHAEQMLRRMRGQEHQVFSGLCLWRRPDDRTWGQVVVSQLLMDAISDSQLTDYLDSEGWVGKAGAFGYQDGLDWVHLIDGSESNVVGLPMESLKRLLIEVEATPAG